MPRYSLVCKDFRAAALKAAPTSLALVAQASEGEDNIEILQRAELVDSFLSNRSMAERLLEISVTDCFALEDTSKYYVAYYTNKTGRGGEKSRKHLKLGETLKALQNLLAWSDSPLSSLERLILDLGCDGPRGDEFRTPKVVDQQGPARNTDDLLEDAVSSTRVEEAASPLI